MGFEDTPLTCMPFVTSYRLTLAYKRTVYRYYKHPVAGWETWFAVRVPLIFRAREVDRQASMRRKRQGSVAS